MSILTKEGIQKILNDDWLLMDDCEGLENCTVIKELARMALAAMDSEPVAEVLSNRPGNDTSTIDRALPVGTQLYRHAQTAPGVLDDYQHLRELYHAQEKRLFKIAQRLKGPTFDKYSHSPSQAIDVLEVAIFGEDEACRAAMLQHQPQNAQQNIPENIPGGLVEAVNNLLNNDGSRGCYDAMECGTAREKIELWLAQRQRWEEQRKANLSAGNSPVIPDGYRLQPISEYEAMCATVNSDEWPHRWIPVSERMPEKNGTYQVWNGEHVGAVPFLFGSFQCLNPEQVTHWMPTAKPPREVK